MAPNGKRVRKSACFTVVAWYFLMGAAFAAIDVAVSVDDLPTHGALPPGTTRLDVTRRMIHAFKAHHVPEVYGFTNGKQAREHPEHLEILTRWLQAGFPLGNHTFSHLNLDQVSASEFIADIEKNEEFLAGLSRDNHFKIFRYPYLREGNSLDKRNVVRASLAAKGYRIAQVTVYFDDWAWNDPYARCLFKGDLQAIEWLKQRFMESAKSRLAWSQGVAARVFKRPVKQILLLHIGAFDALMLDELLTGYERSGVRFIPLGTAIRDPAYAVNPNIAWEGELTFFEQLARSKRLSLPTSPTIPLQALETLCR